ncbi:hypothetical protein C7S18_03395 [Ahniella affigens]|uniref:DUF1631 domain-containing protein n=1 Tax=Ahniella affigens TaxID=2021234 RepID=A0A2P1PN69_9GAMM|nr:DUF1631 family protein [Ahniella affigens]AVP96290.1 hypothetical protein C7S18_03395 [Ahniella affigens]
MSSDFSSSRNVLPFQRADAQTESRNRRLFDALTTAWQQPVQDLCTLVFQDGDDALFDRSERAGNFNQQSTHFDIMRRLRLAKVDLAARTFEAVQSELARLLGTRNERYGRMPVPAQSDTLSLVDPDTIESEVAAQAAASRVRNRYSQDFQALSKRFSTVQWVPQEGDQNNTLGPEMLCMSFMQALNHFECTLETRLVLMKLFERELLKACETLLMRAHAAMNACQVAVDVPYRTFQRPTAPASAAPAAGLPAAMPSPSAAEVAAAANPYAIPAGGFTTDQAIMHSLRELINALGLRYAAHHRFQPGSGLPVASRQELTEAIQAVALQFEQPAVSRPDSLSTAIIETLTQQRNGSTVQIRPLDAGLIDLMGMMFDYTVSDRHLPAELQAVLGHLQIPYLKLALADPQFLARREHPARLLLNELAQAALGWTEATDRGLKTLMTRMVDDLMKVSDPQPELFAALRKELAEFAGKEHQRVQLAERKASQAADGKNRMEVAKRDTEETLRVKLGSTELPMAMAKLVEQYWQQYLVLTHVRHGRDSQEWLDALRLVDLLAHFPKADASPEMVAPWRKQFAEVEAQLRQGMKQTGVTEADCDLIMSGLRELVQIEHQQTVAERVIERAETPRVKIEALQPKPVEAPLIAAQSASAEEELGPWVEKARAMKSGQWFEWQKQPGKTEQIKLLWISGDHQQFMFVNGNGIKAMERKLGELALDLKAEALKTLESKPLVERALAAAMQRVRGRRSA